MKLLRIIPSNTHGFSIFLPLVLLLCGAQPSHGQNARLDLKNLDKLASKASEVNDVTLDADMLKLASNSLTSDAVKNSHPEKAEKIDKARSLMNNLKGVYVKNFAFDKENQYSMEDIESIRSQLNGPGWSRIVSSRNSKHGGELDEIYVMRDGDKTLGVAILVAEPKELTVVNILGPLDLSQLGQLGNLGSLGKLGGMSDHTDASPAASPSNKTDTTDKTDRESK